MTEFDYALLGNPLLRRVYMAGYNDGVESVDAIPLGEGTTSEKQDRRVHALLDGNTAAKWTKAETTDGTPTKVSERRRGPKASKAIVAKGKVTPLLLGDFAEERGFNRTLASRVFNSLSSNDVRAEADKHNVDLEWDSAGVTGYPLEGLRALDEAGVLPDLTGFGPDSKSYALFKELAKLAG